ncbi:MAG: hypothetical protein IPP62_15530 [bacterium]|nr:hypothetical protein [bacterium]
MGRFFQLIVVESNSAREARPSRAYRHALEFFAVAPCDTSMVGDNLEWDVAGAAGSASGASGMTTAARGFPTARW